MLSMSTCPIGTPCSCLLYTSALTGRVIPMTVNALERPDRALGEFHCIVSNPPYIPHGDIPGLDHSVKDYEPHLALDGGEDGLDFYRAISEKWKAALAPGGRLYFEVGIGQADAVLRIMRAQGFGDIQVVKDHNDIPRVVFGTLCGEVYSCLLYTSGPHRRMRSALHSIPTAAGRNPMFRCCGSRPSAAPNGSGWQCGRDLSLIHICGRRRCRRGGTPGYRPCGR